MDLGALLKKEIKKKGYTQQSLGKIVGVSNNAISQICIGATFPHKRTLENICKALKIKIEFSIVDDSKS